MQVEIYDIMAIGFGDQISATRCRLLGCELCPKSLKLLLLIYTSSSPFIYNKSTSLGWFVKAGTSNSQIEVKAIIIRSILY